MKAPEHVQIAVLETLKWAMVYCRNYSLKSEANMVQVNDLMEATHEVPSILLRWPDDALDKIRMHLGCFNHKKWEGSPDLVAYLNNALQKAKT